MNVTPGTKWSVMLPLLCFCIAIPFAQAQYYHPEYEIPETTTPPAPLTEFTGTVTLTTGPKGNDQDYARARDLIRNEQIAEGCALLKKLIEANPAYMNAWELLGKTYWGNGRQEEAIRLWKNLNAIAPEELVGHNSLGDAYRARNDLERAIDSYRASLAIDPDQPETTLQLARVLRWNGNLEEAIAVLSPLLESHPAREDFKAELARAYQSNRQYDLALPLWNELLESEPDNSSFLARQTIAMFYVGDQNQAMIQADYVASRNPTNSEILKLLADAEEFGDQELNAIPHLNQLYNLQPTPGKKRAILNRIITLFNRVYDRYADELPIEDLAERIRGQIRLEPRNPDLVLALADVYFMMGDLDSAAATFQEVLDTMNPGNIRAHRGLFEIAMSHNDFKAAEKALDAVESFNPQDPYLHYVRARLYADQNNYRAAFREVDRLEEKGFRGSVAVLLYHGLSISDTTALMPVSVFKEHVESLETAGYRFITAAEIPDYFRQYERRRELLDITNIERVVCITFDDARRDAMRIGTPAAQELDQVLSMHVPAGYMVMPHPFLCTWEMLEAYENSGKWIMGGHLYLGHENEPIDGDGNLCHPLANRIWLEEAGRLETTNEYLARVSFEYRESQKLIENHLPTATPCPFVAYPFGDIGQQTLCNVANAVAINLAEAARHYKLGFIQSPFGYAMVDDNPLLYQRTEGERWETGSEVVTRVLKHHPVLLARRMRAEFAAMAGKKLLARDALYALQQGGYPPAALEKTWTYVERLLSRRIPPNENYTPDPDAPPPPPPPKEPAPPAPEPLLPEPPDGPPSFPLLTLPPPVPVEPGPEQPETTGTDPALPRPTPAPTEPDDGPPESESEPAAKAPAQPRLNLLRDNLGLLP